MKISLKLRCRIKPNRKILGFPKLGLNGTAVAMLIAQTICLVAFFVYLAKKNHIVAPDWRHLSLHWPTVFTVMKIGLPAGAQQLLVAFGSAVMLFFVNRYGESATAGFGAASQIDMVAFFIAMSFSMAIASLAGQNIGAQRPDRVRELFKWGMLLSGGMVLVITLLALTVPTVLMSMFVNARTNPQAFHIGIGYLRIVGCSYITFAVMFVCIGIINGAGHTLVTTILSFIGLWGVRIPLAAYLSHRMHSVEGIWWAMATSFTVTTVLSLAYFFSGRWKSSVFAAGAGRRKFVAADDAEMFG